MWTCNAQLLRHCERMECVNPSCRRLEITSVCFANLVMTFYTKYIVFRHCEHSEAISRIGIITFNNILRTVSHSLKWMLGSKEAPYMLRNQLNPSFFQILR